MGKAFTKEEHKKNIDKLKVEGRKLAIENGFRKASIDELVKRCGISKGQFYRYYETKEIFFFNIREEVENEIQEKIKKGFISRQAITKEIIIDNFCELFKLIQKPNYKVFFDHEEIRYLFQRLPKNEIKEDFNKDSLVVEGILNMVTGDLQFEQKYIDILTGIIRSIFLICNNVEIIGKDLIDDIVRYHVEGMVEFISKKIISQRL